MSLNDKAKKIKLILMDVDGVLTKGEIIFDSNGKELKIWNVRDGLAFSIVKRIKDIELGFITGRESESVKNRADDSGVKYLVMGCLDKLVAYHDICNKSGYKSDEIAYIGDDLIDIPILKEVGFSACPNDAVSEVKEIVDFVSDVKGGYGVFRDVLKFVLQSQNRWQGIEKVFQGNQINQ